MSIHEPSPPPPVPAPARHGEGIAPGWAAAPWWLGALLGMAGVAALLVLWRNEPSGQLYYPRCLLYVATGLQCPGCGILRSTHALMNGRWGDAWRLNPLWVSLLPWMGWGVVAGILRGMGLRAWQPWARPWAIGVVAGLGMAYAVVRNVPTLLGAP